MIISKSWWVGGLAAVMLGGGLTLAQAKESHRSLFSSGHHAKLASASVKGHHHKTHILASVHHKTKLTHHAHIKTHHLKNSLHHRSTHSLKSRHVGVASLHRSRTSHLTTKAVATNHATAVQPPMDSTATNSVPTQTYNPGPAMQAPAQAPMQAPAAMPGPAADSVPTGLDANTPAR